MNDKTDMCSMPGMESMCGGHAAFATHATAPAWLLYALAVWFAAGAFFYLYRILSPRTIQVYGRRDLENEISHALCLAAMVTMIEPWMLPLPFLFWVVVLGVAAVWFMARTVFWGRKKPGNKWWWDAIHVGMLGFMALMFAGISSFLVDSVASAFWIFFAGYAAYYAYKLRQTGPSYGWLEVGSDWAHITMGVVMLIMTIAPTLFMPPMEAMNMNSMAGAICHTR
jgi:hypothetical protein